MNKPLTGFMVTLIWLTTSMLNAQDAYHQELIQTLSADYELDAPGFVFYDNEMEIRDNKFIYGDATQQHVDVENFAFSIRTDIIVNSAGENAWDAGSGLSNVTPINQGDAILLVFWARKSSVDSEVSVFAEDGSSFEKEVFFGIGFSDDWNQYFVPFRASKDYGVGELAFGFHLAARAQQFSLAGYTALNYGAIDPDRLPSTNSPGMYGGFEADASWRGPAQARIDSLRRKRIEVSVVDADGRAIEGATVQVDMIKHNFGFGSAVVAGRFPGNRNANEFYVSKIFDLDGQGHGFNEVVTENALKWDGWEEEWIGTPEETTSAIEMLFDSGIHVRGHTLIWPGWGNLPVDMEQNQADLSYLRGRINERLSSMLEHEVLGVAIRDWDILNEITQVRDLEMSFASDPNFSTGRELYPEIIGLANDLDSNNQFYINDYVVLSGGGSPQSVVDRYINYLDEIEASGVDWHGIGFQCHIGTQPTSILKLSETLDEFYNRYGRRMKITEYDINPNVDEETQAAYLNDFLTMVYSHPGVDAFLMWGFWDGNHWKGNAPMFNLDWSLKPSGQVFIDKVFGEWWSNESAISDTAGVATVDVFDGVHQIAVTYNGEEFQTQLSTDTSNQVHVVFQSTSNRIHQPKQYQILPNPARDILHIQGEIAKVKSVVALNLQGQVVQSWNGRERIQLNLPNGAYILRLETQSTAEYHRIAISQ